MTINHVEQDTVRVSGRDMPKPRSLNTVRWQTLNYPDLLREEWEGEWFLFNPASGNTHVLNRLAVDILERIDVQSVTLPELAQALIEEYQPDLPTQFSAQLEQHLKQLVELGLITPQSPRTASA